MSNKSHDLQALIVLTKNRDTFEFFQFNSSSPVETDSKLPRDVLHCRVNLQHRSGKISRARVATWFKSSDQRKQPGEKAKEET
jgi:hypothetical protein